jgi:hypothetical protein
MKTFTHTFEISDEAYALLLSIQKEGYAEYRDTQWESLAVFLVDETLFRLNHSKENFLSRNHGGTYYLTGELLKYNLIDHVEDSWHITYQLTDFGKEMLSLQNVRDQKLNEILK